MLLLPPLLMSFMAFLAGLKLVSSSGIDIKKGVRSKKQVRTIYLRARARQATSLTAIGRNLCVGLPQLTSSEMAS